MKKLNWKAIEPRKISKSSLWVKCQGESLATEDMFNKLSLEFSLKPSRIVSAKASSKLDHQVLDGKTVQNILIFKRGFLKGLSNEQIIQQIMRCEISADTIEGLMQCLPNSDQVKRLCDLKDTVQLSEAEEFVASIGHIQDLESRLRAILFKKNFADLVMDLEPNMALATLACDEIKSSAKFAKLLEIILSIGNYMNGSIGTSIPAFGFDISFVANICDIKDSNNKRTLLHFLIDEIKQKQPHLLRICDDMPHLKKVGNVHSEKIQGDLLEITKSLEEVKFLLGKIEDRKSCNDKFVEKMKEFDMRCETKLEKLIKMEKQMTNSYNAVADYFSFDSNQYQMEELFSDLRKFMCSFSNAITDLKINPKNHKIKDKENSGICVNQKQRPNSYSATDDTIRKLSQRDHIIEIDEILSEGLFSFFMFTFVVQFIYYTDFT